MSSNTAIPNQPLAIDTTSASIDQNPVQENLSTFTVPNESTNCKPPTDSQGGIVDVVTDNGIFDFMSPEKAIELYKRLHKEGKLDLKWKFHGRKSPNDSKSNLEINQDQEVSTETKETDQDQRVNTEFDFDEEFVELKDETSTGEILRLQKRPEAGVEKRTNLSDIMNDIRKKISQENEVISEQPNEGS